MVSSLINPINIFLGIREPNVTFCLDISGSMYSTIRVVKEQLAQYLLEQSVLANLNLNRLFNLIAFSTEVYPWANSMVLWNTATVNSAIDWIKDLETKTGTNTLDALMSAFQDSKCDSVVLVTDDISDQEPYTVLNQVSLISKGRPVHCIYILDGREEDRSTTEFLQNLASITRGSFKIVNCGRHGVEKITPIITYDLPSTFQLVNLTLNANSNPAYIDTKVTSSSSTSSVPALALCSSSQLSSSSSKCCCCSNNQETSSTYGAHLVSLPIENHQTTVTSKYQPSVILPNYTYSYPKWLFEPELYAYPSFYNYPRVLLTNEGKIPSKSVAWSRYRPVKMLYDGTVLGLTVQDTNLPVSEDIAYTPDAGIFLVNRNVVARCKLDGYYYKGKVLNQILAHRFNIQFGPSENGKYKDSFYQDTAIYDIIHYEDSISHSVRTNDKVLALIDGVEKYAPAEVLEGFEKRSSNDEHDKKTENKPITVRFVNGKTRTLPPNEAIWLPDAMYERIKFEFNLPSGARKYLEEYNDEYPNNSLPGYPTSTSSTTSLKSIDSVVMPRMVYDIWPYYVPFYPLYSNILYPSLNSVVGTTTTTTNLRQDSLVGPLSLTPTYYRQMRTNSAAIDAESLNSKVIGTLLSTNEFDEKIRQQIHNHRHLITTHRSKSRCKSPKYNCKCCHVNTERQIVHQHSLSNDEDQNPHHCHSNHHRHNHHHNPAIVSQRVHAVNNSNTPLPLCESHSNNLYDNKHYRLYQKLIQQLYDDAKIQEEKQHYCRCAHHDECDEASSLKRSKSVTFSDSHSTLVECCHSDYESDSETCCSTDREFHKNQSVNTEVTFAKKEKTNDKKQADTNNLQDRFGNPKVSIGLPERLLTRPRSATGNLDLHLSCKSTEDLNENFKRDQSAKREQVRVEEQQNQIKKQEQIEQHHRNLSNQILQLEKKRADNAFVKEQDRILAKKEINSINLNRLDSIKTDIEAKEQMKYWYLRNQANKRDMEHLNNLKEQTLKEANKLAFKREQTNIRNQNYHDRILIEEALRKENQKQTQLFHNRNASKELKRDASGQKLALLKQSVNENNLIKAQNQLLK